MRFADPHIPYFDNRRYGGELKFDSNRKTRIDRVPVRVGPVCQTGAISDDGHLIVSKCAPLFVYRNSHRNRVCAGSYVWQLKLRRFRYK